MRIPRPKNGSLVFLLAWLVAAAMLVISEGSYRRSQDTLDQLVQMARARLLLYGIKARVVDAETAQRGYLLTGRREYLAPYEEANDDLQRSLKDLKVHLTERADPVALQLHQQLELAVGTKMGELAEVLKRQEAGRPDAALALMEAGIGRDQMELIRSRAEQLLYLQSERVLQGRAEVHAALLLSRLGVAAMTVISLLALAMYLRQSHRLAEQGRRQAGEIKAERDRLEVDVAQRTAELTELATHLETAREDERRHLARELHDELGALLTAAKLDAARIRPKLAPEQQERMTHLVEMLNSGIALKRRIIEDLHPSSLTNLGLLPALELQAREFAKRLDLPVRITLAEVRLSPRAELTVYRMVQEAFTNIAKYAKASAVSLTLEVVDGQARVEVSDNGIGFDPAQQPPSSHGLVGMRYRVAAEGGTLKLASSPGRGTLLSAQLPQLPQLPV
ncbi:CHASE3 domain-containing protein [Roseateles sp.]|uniref:CHASE3 domain-containing protein n=1 Tax=Roseateles sp. TaxID=1971397 RepID=UPI00286CF424|nr:CHASE3 domain-containing protein [Roseateles sp.]